MKTTHPFLFALSVASLSADAFHLPMSSSSLLSNRRVVLNAEGTGGWGLGNSREMVPEEFARGERKAFEGYQLRDRGEFMRQVNEEKSMMKKRELDELLAVAQIAGIKVKDPKERLNKFDQALLEDDDDDLDVSIPWEDSDPFQKR